MDPPTLTVKTEHGPVKGIQKFSALDRDYFSYQGIPYMKAPIGKLRFRDPQPPEKWLEPLDGSQEPPSFCFFHTLTSFKGGQEDAGILNVYVPINSSSDLLPVMTFIHGGGFQMGSSRTDIYGPDYFMQKDVILVTMNYRLGPIGFLSLQDPSLKVPGNAGLKDQLQALKWIQKNIENFGGNPKNVTLFGEGAGGAAVHFHMLSEQSKGLFNKAILMSGCAFNKTWCMPPKKDFAHRLGKALGWDGNGGEKKLLEILENANAHELMQHSAPSSILNDEDFAEFLIFGFCPIIEPYKTATTFIDKDPILMAREAWSKDINIIIGATSFEGAFATIFDRKEQFIEKMENASFFAPLSELGLSVDSDDASRFGTRIKKIYFEYAHVTNTNFELFCQYSTDRHFWHGIQNAVKSRVGSNGLGKTYLYRFEANTDLNELKKYNKVEHFPGATHGDTIFYIFLGCRVKAPEADTKEFEVMQKIIDWMTKFASLGDRNAENPNWEPVISIKPPLNCFNMTEKKFELISLPESDRLMIWDTVYKDAKVEMF